MLWKPPLQTGRRQCRPEIRKGRIPDHCRYLIVAEKARVLLKSSKYPLHVPRLGEGASVAGLTHYGPTGLLRSLLDVRPRQWQQVQRPKALRNCHGTDTTQLEGVLVVECVVHPSNLSVQLHEGGAGSRIVPPASIRTESPDPSKKRCQAPGFRPHHPNQQGIAEGR